MRIVFPTKENMSYMSHSASDFEQAQFLTVLDVNNDKIIGVETIKNKKIENNEDFISVFKENQYDAIVVPQSNTLPLKDLKDAGINVYNDADSQVVLSALSDYVHQKLAMA